MNGKFIFSPITLKMVPYSKQCLSLSPYSEITIDDDFSMSTRIP